MKVRTSTEAHEKLNDEIAWRKKEIINLRNRLSLSSGFDAQTLSKCIVLISYSHWEGFVKNASVIYLTYVKTVASNPSNFSNALKASLLAWYFSIENKSILSKIEVIENKIWGTEKLNFYIKDMCSTESNLNYNVLQKILYSMGIHTDVFDLKKNYIDETILGNRNAIAHGEQRESLSTSQAQDIAKEVLVLLDWFKTEIDNAIDSSKWKKS